MDALKCKLKFSFFDILLCFVIASAVLFVLFRPKGIERYAEYTLLINAGEYCASALTVGRTVLDGASKEICGTILSVHTEPFLQENRNGTITVPEKKRFFVTVAGTGHEKNGCFTIGGFSPIPGKTIFLHAPCFAEGVCLSVRLGDKI